ncbi:MAG: oligoribonuclease [Bowdeniella nasicola]|nr:oligoribonuclease [Bowdeniella nasicola]
MKEIATGTTKDLLVWIDCEMTGLDLTIDELIEVAVIVTDAELEPLDSGIDVLIKPSEAALNNMSSFVRQMHTSSGLLEDLADAGSLAEATEQVMGYLRQHLPEPGKAPLAGNSVATDKAFLHKDMPTVTDHLHYRMIDVSSFKELARRWYPRVYFNTPQKNGGHRALADIAESIDELRYYRQILWPGKQGPTTEECRRAAAAISASATLEKLTR